MKHIFLFECSGMSKERDILYSIINIHCKNFTLLPNDSKLIWILNNENLDILKGVCSYIDHISQWISTNFMRNIPTVVKLYMGYACVGCMLHKTGHTTIYTYNFYLVFIYYQIEKLTNLHLPFMTFVFGW